MWSPPHSRHQRAASSGSSQAANGTGGLPCLRREKRSSSAAATVSPSTTSAAAGAWKTALIPSTTAMYAAALTEKRFSSNGRGQNFDHEQIGTTAEVIHPAGVSAGVLGDR